MSKTNPKNAGRTPKYRPDVKTKTIHWLIPTILEYELMEFLQQKSKERDLLTKGESR